MQPAIANRSTPNIGPLRSAAAAVAVVIGLSASAFAADVLPRPSAGCAASSVQQGNRLERSIEVDGVPRAYILDVPPRVEARKPVPLLFDFHGFGHSAAGVWQVSGFRELAVRTGFITVYPDGLPVHLLGRDAPGWEIFSAAPNRDLAFVRQVLDRLEQTYCIDRARVFATGFSNGAYLSHLIGCTMADRFAAIAPVSGGKISVGCTPSRAVPVIIHHGRKDDVIDVQQAHAARDQWLAIDQCREHAADGCEMHRECRDGAEVQYCEDDSAHRWPAEATARIWKFFTEHPLP